MIWCRRITYGVLALAGVIGCRPAQLEPLLPSERGIQGAWRVVQEWTGRPGDAGVTTSALQASLYIFARRHYSIMFVPGSEPRRLFARQGRPTDPEKVAAYDSFVANSGTYEVSGSRVIYRPVVARSPNFMAGVVDTLGYDIRGDTLWLTSGSGAAPDAPVTRLKLVRLE